jgi:hypothetical protein
MVINLNLLPEVKNIHKGHRAIVLGSGYFLDKIDFSKISREDIIFSCNQSITALKYCDYFCMVDEAIPGSNYFTYGLSIANKVAFCNIHMIKSQAIRYDDRVNVDFDLNDGLLITGTDVVHVTAHLSHIMGCFPIILAGVDLNHDSGKKYCNSDEFNNEIIYQPGIKRVTIPKNSSGSDDRDLEKSFETWERIKNSNKQITFLNVNPKGRLSELFETVNLPFIKI